MVGMSPDVPGMCICLNSSQKQSEVKQNITFLKINLQCHCLFLFIRHPVVESHHHCRIHANAFSNQACSHFLLLLKTKLQLFVEWHTWLEFASLVCQPPSTTPS